MTDHQLRLYELVAENGRSISPFVWRIRYALAHKGLPFTTMPVGFTEIPRLFDGRFKTVPILSHGDVLLNESWAIAEYLDRSFFDRPLFSSPTEHALVRLTDEWFLKEVVRKLFGVYMLDIHGAARPEDRSYFRESREAGLRGRTLETFTADRLERRDAVRASLAPLRAQLARSEYLGGSAPNYADYIVLGVFHWVASVSTLPLLARDDTALIAWLERCFELYGGFGRDVRMRPLFE